MYAINVIFIPVHEGKVRAQYQTNFGNRELQASYYTVKTRTIVLIMTYLSSRTKPTGSPVSPYMHLLNSGSGLRMVSEITRTTHSLVPKFRGNGIYMYPNQFLDL